MEVARPKRSKKKSAKRELPDATEHAEKSNLQEKCETTFDPAADRTGTGTFNNSFNEVLPGLIPTSEGVHGNNVDVEVSSNNPNHELDNVKSLPIDKLDNSINEKIEQAFPMTNSVTEPFFVEESIAPFLPEDDGVSLPIDAVLPVQDDDWDLSTNEQNSDIIYPSLERTTSRQSAVMKPFTDDQRLYFYQNPLLEQNEMYTDQFIIDSTNHHTHFKTLLQNYYQARIKLIKARKHFEEQKENINSLFKSVFSSKQGKITAEAYCQDQRAVKTSHTYEICEFDQEENSKLTSALREGRRLASDDILTCSYISTLCRLRCEQFLFDVTEKYKYHRNNLKVNSETNGSTSQLSILLQLVDECLAILKEVTNTLFSYKRHRKSGDEKDDRYWKDIDRWLSLVILNMIQSTECETESGRHFREELFVLNHVTRCPPGINVWINGLVQVSGPLPFTSKDKTSIDHSMYLLYLILNPAKGRHDFLSQFLVDESADHLPHQQPSEWTMIDEDGDEVDSSSCSNSLNIMPLENDLITLFQQVPFQNLLVHILGLSLSTEEVVEYCDDVLASEDVMATLVVSDQLCNILGESLQTLGRPKYKQLVRRVAQAMRNIVLLISEHLEHYKFTLDESSHQMYSVSRLQLEFDEFCKRCISKLLSVARLGIYQFIADLPFGAMSLRAIETLYLLMNVPAGARAEVEKLVRAEYSKQEWIEFVQDSDTKLAFEEQLSAMPANEIVYLLTAFANLAQTRPSCEEHLINNIVVDIYKISFIYKSTRDICCKTGRELLSSVTFYHPFTISILLHFINDNIIEVQSMAIYSMNDVPFSLWKPHPEDLEVLRSLLINFPPDAVESRFAQYTIKGLNFDRGADESYFLPHETHCHLGLLLVESYVQLMENKQQANLMLKSFDQVSKVASVARLAPSVEHKFTTWCWEIILQLKLHQHEYTSKGHELNKFVVHNMHSEVRLAPLLDAVNNQHPLANYLAIMMTDIGHNMEKFLSEGIELLLALAQLGYAKAVVKCLFCIVPMFCKAKMNLAENDRFKEVLLALLHCADKGYFSDLANRLIPDSQNKPKPTKLVLSAITSHLTNDRGSDEASFLALYWLEMVFAIPDWYKDVYLMQIVDFLFQHAFVIGERCNLGFKTMLYQQLVEMMLHKPNTNTNSHHSSVVSSFLNLVSGNNANQMPCLISTFQQGINIYLGYAALEAEERYEDDSGLWSSVLSALQLDAKLNIDTCLKKVASKLKLWYSPQAGNLSLYRWGELALCTPYDHPLLQAIWLQFFRRFIYLPPDGKNSVGYRFFSAVSILPTYNKLRSQLQSTSEYHVGVISGRSYEDGMKSHHEKCVQLYQSFKLWLEEPKLHEVSLYMPSLPSQYNSDLLACVRTKQQDLFDDFVNLSRIEHNLLKFKENSNGNRKADKKAMSYKTSATDIDTGQRMQKMTQLLKQFEEPQSLPYVVAYGALSSPVALGDVSQIWRYETVMQVIDLDLKIVSSFAEDVLKLQGRLGQIDADYLHVLPNLYYMKDAELWQKVECQSGFSVTHKCSGPASIRLRFKEKSIRGSVSQELKANRNLYQEALNKFLCEDTSDDLCFAALHLESLIHALEGNSNNPAFTKEVKTSVQESGTKLFYLLANMYSKERKVCHPTRHLLSTCVEMLGQLFISQSSDHAENILNEVLSNPASSALLSPHFAPGASQSLPQQSQINNYIQMYQRVMKVVSTNTDEDADVLFVLLTKFEVSMWLEELQPSLSERLELLQHVFVGLISCNLRMKQNEKSIHKTDEDTEKDVLYKALAHQPSHTAMQEIYLNHFTAILKHRFPETLQQAVENLLEASRSNHVKPSVWETVLSTSFNQNLQSQNADGGASTEDKEMYSTNIDWNTLINLLDILTGYFTISILDPNQDQRWTGLMSKWQSYVPVLSRMFSCLSLTFLVFVNEQRMPQDYCTKMLCANEWWCPLTEVLKLYHIWIDPFPNSGGSGALLWPWSEAEEISANWMHESLSDVMVQFCNGPTEQSSVQLQCIFSHYASIVLQSKHELPHYYFTVYHNMLGKLPWNKFVPSPESLEIMVQICEVNSDIVKDFLCKIISTIQWKAFLEMHILTHKTKLENTKSFLENDTTSHAIGQLLHVLFILGSKEVRLTQLIPVFEEVEQFPIHLIGNDQIEYVANLVSDYYNWSSLFLSEPLKSKKNARHRVFRTLKLICRFPLVSEERVKESDGRMLVPTLVATDVLKQQSYVRCVGRLLQKSKPGEFGSLPEFCKRLTRFVEITMESVEMTASYDIDSDNLTSLIFTIFDYLNIMPPAFQQPTLQGFINILSRVPFCKNFLSVDNVGPAHISAQCQDCVYPQSRALGRKTLLACLSASCSIAIFPEYSCQIIEVCIESYISSVTVESYGAESSPVWFRDCWSDILNLFQKSMHQEELCNQCIKHSALLTLHGSLMDPGMMPGFYTVQAELPDSSNLSSQAVLEMTSKLLEWLPQCTSLSKNEAKILLLIDQFLYACSLLWQNALSKTTKEFSVDTVAVHAIKLQQILENFSLDKVRSGFLGSIGIGKQSAFSLNFRLISKCLSMFLHHWHAQVYPASIDHIENAQKAFQSVKNLPQTNKQYVVLTPAIDAVCEFMTNQNRGSLDDYRKLLSIFVKKHYCSVLFLHHLTQEV